MENYKNIKILTDKRLPNESEEYRTKRDELLKKEYELRQLCEQVASMRRELPQGGKLKEDYEFEYKHEGQLKQVKFSELFEGGKDTLFVYNLMFPEEDKEPCPMCACLLDGFEGEAQHIRQRINFFCVTKSNPDKIAQYSEKRGWKNLRLISHGKNTFALDYHGESSKTGMQLPVAHVFKKEKNGDIHHFWMSEMMYSSLGPKVDPRHVDLLWPLWNILDLTPEGRGENFYPKNDYSISPEEKQEKQQEQSQKLNQK